MKDSREIILKKVLRAMAILAVGGAAHAHGQTVAATSSALSDWPMYSYDNANTNFNPNEHKISLRTAKNLRRAWSTFNDSRLVTKPVPTGFLFESVLGLKFPSAVVGVVAPPVISNGTIYYIDELGTMFARDAATGKITDPRRHWTTSLVDPDYQKATTKIVPELYYTALAITDTHVWVLSAVNGRVHAVKRDGGAEVDFDPTTKAIEPFALVPDQTYASAFGDPIIFRTSPAQGSRVLFIAGTAVIVNDVLAGDRNSGVLVCLDITDPAHPVQRWRTPMIDINPATKRPYGSGVSAGSGLAVDIKRGLVYGGTGQNTTEPYPGYPESSLAPAGYIDRGDSLVAVDYMTGAIKWVNQFHRTDVFDLNNPVSAGPNRMDGPRDADVLAPPVLFTATINASGRRVSRDLVGDGSKGGLFRVVDRDTGATVWERQISKPTGLGGIQGGAAYANGNVYIAGFEGVSDGFSDAQFDAPGSKYKNAFFATFSPAFWADVEDLRDDRNPATGMQVKVYKLDAATGKSKWRFRDGKDYVVLPAGANMRHVSVANDLLYVTTTSGELFVLDTANGDTVYRDQSLDLNSYFSLGLGKPHHAAMNAGSLISNGMVYVPYGGQNNPSGGIIVYKPRGDDRHDD